MGRTFRKEKNWEDGTYRSNKNTSKKVNTRSMRVLNSIVEDDEEFDYEDFDYEDSSDTNTTKNHTVKHTT